ncbi:MAG TPA: hypothetical protein ENK49_01890 [Gammaproteobacteria bacterium]|nr:hypothetical protein [Gammaproteobacteria bacterium]
MNTWINTGNRHTELNELTLNAYVDGQLDPELERTVLSAMDQDPAIREQVCQLRRAKDWMRTGFADVQSEDRPLPAYRKHWSRLQTGIAASLMALAIGVGGGLLGYVCAEREAANHLAAYPGHEDPGKVLLHLSDAEPQHFQAVLDYAEHFLQENQGRNVQVEVIANAGGVNLMRAGVSPYEDRVRALSKKYSNLQFVACMNALRNLRREGIEPVLIDDVHSGTTAVDRVVKRLREGWTYRKVDNLSGDI